MKHGEWIYFNIIDIGRALESGGSHGREEIFSVKKGSNIADVVTGKTLLVKIKK